jgi:hypothetical protein
MIPVIALASSEAMSVTTFATSATLGNRFDLSNGAAGQEDVCPLAGEGAGHRAADCPSVGL